MDTVGLLYGGFSFGTRGNRSLVNGKKAFYDFWDARETCMPMLDELVEDLGYEMARRRITYLFLGIGFEV